MSSNLSLYILWQSYILNAKNNNAIVNGIDLSASYNLEHFFPTLSIFK